MFAKTPMVKFEPIKIKPGETRGDSATASELTRVTQLAREIHCAAQLVAVELFDPKSTEVPSIETANGRLLFQPDVGMLNQGAVYISFRKREALITGEGKTLEYEKENEISVPASWLEEVSAELKRKIPDAQAAQHARITREAFETAMSNADKARSPFDRRIGIISEWLRSDDYERIIKAVEEIGLTFQRFESKHDKIPQAMESLLDDVIAAYVDPLRVYNGLIEAPRRVRDAIHKLFSGIGPEGLNFVLDYADMLNLAEDDKEKCRNYGRLALGVVTQIQIDGRGEGLTSEHQTLPSLWPSEKKRIAACLSRFIGLYDAADSEIFRSLITDFASEPD